MEDASQSIESAMDTLIVSMVLTNQLKLIVSSESTISSRPSYEHCMIISVASFWIYFFKVIFLLLMCRTGYFPQSITQSTVHRIPQLYSSYNMVSSEV